MFLSIFVQSGLMLILELANGVNRGTFQEEKLLSKKMNLLHICRLQLIIEELTYAPSLDKLPNQRLF